MHANALFIMLSGIRITPDPEELFLIYIRYCNTILLMSQHFSPHSACHSAPAWESSHTFPGRCG